mmetsp:Transcript_16933/g.51232  ORF Transcript_16933/g.51232 Transcript_16933/m.51232 type:complete len:207 (+) Transcript_16933:1298-1918(+)
MQRYLRTSSMNLRVVRGSAFWPPEWFSQQQPLTTWFSWRTRKPEPIGGACVKMKSFQPSSAGFEATNSSNQRSCASSIDTSCDVYLAARKMVEVSPTSTVFSAISRTKCGVGLPWIRQKASRLASSVSNSSMPSRSWFPPTTSYGTPKEPRYSAASSWQREVPAKSSGEGGSHGLDSPRSPSEMSAAPTPRCCASSSTGTMCSRPS